MGKNSNRRKKLKDQKKPSLGQSNRLKRPLRVGISIWIYDRDQSMWENGIFQNCIFLAQTIRKIPQVGEVFLVTAGNNQPERIKRFLDESPVPYIDMPTALNKLDLMIEMSAQLDQNWMLPFTKRGGKVVSMRVGNDYVIDIERMIYNLPHSRLVVRGNYSEVWTLPQYEKNCASYFEGTFRAPEGTLRTPVRIVPHLWNPYFLKHAINKLPPNLVFGYQPGHQRWRVGMFEPNICQVKASYIPLLCCETAHRNDPQLLEKVTAYCTSNLLENPTFKNFTGSLDIVRHRLTHFEGRQPFCNVVAANVDAIVSHHSENAQNYVYYEALYGGYPLIHNSHLLDDCGYRYHDFNCEEGGKTIMLAKANHDKHFDDYCKKANNFISKLDPEHEANVRSYSDAINSLFEIST